MKLNFIILLLLSLFVVSCDKEQDQDNGRISIEILSTAKGQGLSSITYEMTLNDTIKNFRVIKSGVCYDTLKNPTIDTDTAFFCSDNFYKPLIRTGFEITGTIKNLKPGKKYYIRAYVITDRLGIIYSNQVSLKIHEDDVNPYLIIESPVANSILKRRDELHIHINVSDNYMVKTCSITIDEVDNCCEFYFDTGDMEIMEKDKYIDFDLNFVGTEDIPERRYILTATVKDESGNTSTDDVIFTIN